MSESNCKLVLFNRRETETECDKVEYEPELWTLRDRFESPPRLKKFVVVYVLAGNVKRLKLHALHKAEATQLFRGQYLTATLRSINEV